MPSTTMQAPVSVQAPARADPADADHLLGWLESRDVLCPVCSYNLRALSRPTCPECSAPLKLAVMSPNLNMGPWFVASISLALGLGFDGVVGILLAVNRLFFAPPAPALRLQMLAVMILFLGAAAVCAAALAWLYKRRKHWAFAQRAEQWRTAWLLFAATLVGHLVFGAMILSWTI